MTLEEQLQKSINGTLTDIQGIHDEPLCRVPNYTSREEKTKGTEHTASEDGWIAVNANVKSGSVMTVIVNGVSAVPGEYTNYSSDTYMFAILPIKKGDTFKTQNFSTGTLWFIPTT